jgi:SAM-dependent methyltransferase
LRTLSIELAKWLISSEAQEALEKEKLSGQKLEDRHLLSTLTGLRKSYGLDQAAALLDQARLRQKAMLKFGSAAMQMLFVDEALQQASGQVIARYRAARYASFTYVADLGCGIGGDALALSQTCHKLLALDLDPVRLLFAEHNLKVVHPNSNFKLEQADWTSYEFEPSIKAAFADPSRRVKGRRLFSLHQMRPALQAILELQRRIPHLGVKIMPGVQYDELPDDCEVEWISEKRTCKEAVLWFGDLRIGAARRATVLQNASEGGFWARTLSTNDLAFPLRITPPRAFLWEPEPSVIRATLVSTLAHQLNATQLDPQIAYLTSERATTTPFARCWAVIEHAPFNLKKLNRRLRKLKANVIAVKKRASPIDPERFRRRLKSEPKGQPVTVFITKHLDKPWMIICGAEEPKF